jgi:DNA ligase D-like protein (predicted ligase)
MRTPIPPMLATSAAPFDSLAYCFEVKWDGVRALAAVDAGHWQVWGRALADYTPRYPELEVLRCLPSGTVVDGELVLLQDGRPDLPALLRRHHLLDPARIRHARRQLPVRYVLFDLLYHQGRPLLHEPLVRRRALLQELLSTQKDPLLLFSTGLVGDSCALFAQVVGQGHEGLMAKQQSSRYLPGKRSSSWRKLKPAQVLPCVIIGYTPARSGWRSLLLAAVHQGNFRYVGQVACGFTAQEKVTLGRRLAQRQRPQPVVACLETAVWVQPELYCRVHFQQWTPRGHLRGASFGGLLAESR